MDPPVIACIDDDLAVLEALEELLASYGYDVRAFDSAEKFLESGDLGRFSCVITDLKMRGMSGLRLQKRLAELGSGIPLILITGYGSEENRKRALANGAVAFLRKPIVEGTLLSAIRSALGATND